MDLTYLWDKAKKSWPFDDSRYPTLKGKTQEQKRQFAIDHIMKHQIKSAALVIAVLETLEHGETLDQEGVKSLRTAGVKMPLNTLRFLQFLDVTPELAEGRINEWGEKK